ncbi:MFS general substrate transporter [Saccharata proteae CBS 121410]|uniref:MFS general substrate transporter n=1 Tax=Saccharata proteae CBS 121410 TaxID=1314787 RepID=A0A9P4HSS5_9PEZI|nr:MFS general substrate transporter [Saccharata proteae CBS 121410]
MVAAVGGLDARTRHYEHEEEEPLLGVTRTHSNRDAKDAWPGQSHFDGLPWYKRPHILWILPPFFLSALAFGGIVVPKLNLILTLICREYFASEASKTPNTTFLPVIFGQENSQCRIPEVQSRVAQFTLYGNLISGLLCALSAPKLGALSDRWGRLRILVLTNCGMLCGEVITIIAARFPETIPVGWILVGYAFEGMFGSFIAAMALVHSYATDCTPPARRNVVFGYFHGCLFTGIALGPLIAAYIIRALDSVLSVFYIAIGCHIFFVLFTGLAIPESLSKARQQAAREKYREDSLAAGPAADWINQIRSFNLLSPLAVLRPKGSSPAIRAVRRNLLLLASIDTIVFGVAMGSMTVIVIYTNYAFGWTNFESSRFISIINICRVSVLLALLPLATKLFKRAPAPPAPSFTPFDLSAIRLAITFDLLGFLGFALARDSTLFTIAGCVASVGGMASPTLQAALVAHVPAERTGELLGANGLLHALARVVAPAVFNAIYAATVGWGGGGTQTVFWCLFGVFGVAWGVSWAVRSRVGWEVGMEREAGTGTGGDGEEGEEGDAQAQARAQEREQRA